MLVQTDKKFRHDPRIEACKLNAPNYLSDLNAMHEAEKVLTIPQREDYITLLNNTYTIDSPNTMWWSNTHATDTQRAEAFLRVLGKRVE